MAAFSHNASARGAEESVVYMKFYNGACKQTRQGKINSTVTQLSKHAHEQQPRIFNDVAIAVLMQQLELYRALVIAAEEEEEEEREREDGMM